MAKTPKSTSGKIGSTDSSMLTEAQYQAINGVEWILSDGRSVVGSVYEAITGNSTVPDARGQFIRGKNNGRADGQQNPDGEVVLGVQTGDAIRNITGSLRASTLPTGASIARTGFVNGNTSNYNSGFAGGGGNPDTGTTYTMSASAVVPTASDNRPKNITTNIFIKIN